ncbi:polysaccharide deacetylase family protein [Mucilaginibacter sp. UYCu711]|uniref:polysaccharide deacetylase family protein n=1 Tax=Mucilaginibacter sp. UYCu711 TaxID=3156339 RepID=UPI003D1DF09C
MKKLLSRGFVILMAMIGLAIPARAQYGGVVISLDDHFVNEWVKADSIFYPQYKWKVTFFVSAFGKIKPNLQQKLLNLQAEGHEIGYHGTTHINAAEYLKTHTLDQYLTDDFTQLQPMRDMGFKVTSFAYPNGTRTGQTDSALLKTFTMLRGVSSKEKADKDNGCFYQGKPLIDGMGMEIHYPYFSPEYMTSLLTYARDHNTVLCVYSHKPVPVADPKQHEVDYATLRLICEFVKKNKMKFMTMNELAGRKAR